MNREGAQKVVMVLVGLLFVAAIYLMGMSLWHPSPSDDDVAEVRRATSGAPSGNKHRVAVGFIFLSAISARVGLGQGRGRRHWNRLPFVSADVSSRLQGNAVHFM